MSRDTGVALRPGSLAALKLLSGFHPNGRHDLAYRRSGSQTVFGGAVRSRAWTIASKGDVFSLVEHLDDIGFGEVLQRVSDLVDFVASEPVWTRQVRERDPDVSISERWRERRKLWRSSRTWRYLSDERGLPEAVIRAAIEQDRLREGPRGSMWAAHIGEDGLATGWEERGPEWRGFASSGGKVLFRLGPIGALRLCITEAAIDAMSLAAIEGLRPDRLYLSTGGGWAPATQAAIRALAVRPNVQFVAATDNNAQGEVYAGRIEAIAVAATCGCERLALAREDWNEELRAIRGREKDGRKEKETQLPHARRPPQG